MTNGNAELVVLQRSQQEIDRPLSGLEIRAAVNVIQDVMRAVMKKDVHYGTIPGTPKPTLYQPGADKLLSTFRIATEPIVEDLSTIDEARYRVIVRATSQATGVFLGSGVGECSSNEAKYKWRAPVCQQEFDETPEDRRRELWKKGKDGPYKQRQIRTEPSDVANTILKMATKRAKIAVTITVTAASDIFSQDIEDLPEGILEAVAHDEGHAIEQLREPQPAAQPEHADGTRIKSVRVAKTGTTKKGEAWKLSIVEFTDGVDCTTFSESLASIAKDLLSRQVAVTYEFETDKDGRKSLVLIEEVR